MAFKLTVLALLLLRTASLVAALPPFLNVSLIIPDLTNLQPATVQLRIRNQENTPVTILGISGLIDNDYSYNTLEAVAYGTEIAAHGIENLQFTFTPSFYPWQLPADFNLKLFLGTSYNGWTVELEERRTRISLS